MTKPTFPTTKEIKEAIKKIENKNYLNKMKSKNQSKEGLNKCLEILKDRLKNPENPYFIAESEEEWDQVNEIFKSQLKGIEDLKEISSRSMAILCVDWLNGSKDSINFLNQK